VRSSQHTYSSAEELKQIQFHARHSQSVAELRNYFERIQSLRRIHIDDFDLQVLIADVQELIIERVRAVRDAAPNAARQEEGALERGEASHSLIAGEAEPIDPKTWQRATFIGLLFTAIILAGFFYLVQAARKSNLLLPASMPAASLAGVQNANPAAGSPAPVHPMLRLYTDLVPGTVSIDNGPPQDLKDGELVLDKLAPGRHSIRVSGASGNAEFTYDASEKDAPEIIGAPSAANAMAVLVTTQDGKAHLVTNAEDADVSIDGSPAGHVAADGLTIASLTKADHELDVAQGKDRQRFILTYTPSPALTVYVKSDPNAGTVVLVTHEDDVEVFINDVLYRRRTWHGQLRIPLKVGEYTIRVHKQGFVDPPPAAVQVKKAEETAVQFAMQPVPQIATLAIHGAVPGTMVYVDKDLAAVIGSDGNAMMSNVKPGDRTIELRREQSLPKKFQRTFRAGETVTLSGTDVAMANAIVDSKPAAPVPAPSPATTAAASKANYSMEMEGEQVRKGGGFVAYHVPRISGHYSFMAQARKGGFLKHAKLQWYAGYLDSKDYVLFALDGKHAVIREVRGGKGFDVARVPFAAGGNQWVQVDMQVQPGVIDARVKTPTSGWVDIGGPVAAAGEDFTQGKVGFYIPGNDELAVSNFRFSNR
jgi:hypothetical protein